MFVAFIAHMLSFLLTILSHCVLVFLLCILLFACPLRLCELLLPQHEIWSEHFWECIIIWIFDVIFDIFCFLNRKLLQMLNGALWHMCQHGMLCLNSNEQTFWKVIGYLTQCVWWLTGHCMNLVHLKKKTEFNLMVIVLFLDSDEWKLTVSENVKYSIELKWAFNSKCFQRMCIRPSENFNLSHSQCVLNRRVNYFSKFFFSVCGLELQIFLTLFFITLKLLEQYFIMIEKFLSSMVSFENIWSLAKSGFGLKKNPFDLF